jgi:hypothetical protein
MICQHPIPEFISDLDFLVEGVGDLVAFVVIWCECEFHGGCRPMGVAGLTTSAGALDQFFAFVAS